MYRVIVVDDELVIRKGLRETIEWDSLGLEVAGEAADGVEALKLCRAIRPEILITDIRMPEMDGLQLIQEVKKLDFDVKITILSGYSDYDYLKAAIRLGVDNYLLKPIDNDELICGHARPPIATVEPNFYGAGFIAAATLQEMMEGHRAPRVVKVGESVNRIVARQSARPSSGAPTLVRQARDLIRANAAKLDVVRLAHALGVSRTKLTDAFAKSGSSVAAEIREVRFAKVMELLADPHQAIGPIANLCGWRSETHLMHFFRSRTGMTMREWRARHLAPESATP